MKSREPQVMNRDLKILGNVPATLDLIPSIIDYITNVGLRETSEKWIEFLDRDGNLASDIQLKSVLKDLAESNAELAHALSALEFEF